MWRQHLRPRFLASADVAILAIVAYAPFLLSSPGRLSSDTKQALYVDPGAFLRDAPYLWDPSVAAGTVPHQRIGYLWPMGPWYWSMDLLGVPIWVAQRLWLGTLALLAALGVRWLVRSLGLGRSAALAASLVYALTPYQLAFTARMSVLLLPMAALPWTVELTRRAIRHGGWRHPAIFGLVVTSAVGVNAPAMLLVGLAPLLVLVLGLLGGPDRRRRAVGAGLRIGVFLLPLSAWWMSGLAIQGAYGIPILETTEPVSAVASRSSPDDVLRGLGNWFFYGRDRAGWSLDQASYYDGQARTIALSLLVPMAALAVAAVLRWRGRATAVAAALLAVVVAVGAWPYEAPSPVGRAFRRLTEQTAAGMAFRNSPRIVPVLVLAFAVLLGAAIATLPARFRPIAAGGVSLLAVAGLAPVLVTGMLSVGVERPAEIPAEWTDAAQHLDGSGSGARVLEIPGSNFATHRWGNTVEPILPLLIDRPHLAREVLPYGTPGSALLLDALDRRLQNGLLDPAAVAPVARLLGVGDVVVRSDLRHELFGLAAPGQVWDVVVDPPAPGLAAPVTFGDPVLDHPDPQLVPEAPPDSQVEAPDPGPFPPVAVLEVSDRPAIVRLAPTGGSVLLAGDADGIVDAAAAGLIDGRALILLTAGLDDGVLDRAIDADASLVVTDSNRRRIQTWFSSIVNTRGPTERAGTTEVEPTGTDGRLDAFPGSGDDSRTVAEHIGATVSGSGSGGAARPEDRPVAAFDGRSATSWRVGGADPRGSAVTARFDEERILDQLVLLQPQDGPRDRMVTRVTVAFDGGDRVDFDLDESSFEPPGQVVTFPSRSAGEITVEVAAVSTPSFDPALANAVGFAEIGIEGLVVEETMRMPVDLLDRTGADGLGNSLDLVMVRLRSDPDEWGRGDDEGRIDRSFDLPARRSFEVTGTVRPAEPAPDAPIGGGSSSCRVDLLTVDDEPLSVRLVAADDDRALRLESCAPVALGPGRHRVVATWGDETGFHVDSLIWSSGSGGAATATGTRGTPVAQAPGHITDLDTARTTVRATIEADGEPFWFVLGQSASDGWTIQVDGASVADRALADGYSDAWLVSPDGPGTVVVHVSWTPQRLVWWALSLSLAAAVVAGAVVVVTSPTGPPPPAPRPSWAWPAGDAATSDAAPTGVALRAAAVSALVLAAVSRPWIAVLAGVAALVVGLLPAAAWGVAVLAPATLAGAHLLDRPELGWLAVAWVVAVVVADLFRNRSPGSR